LGEHNQFFRGYNEQPFKVKQKKTTIHKKRGGGNCGSSGCKKSQDNPWHQIDRESSRKTVYNNNTQNIREKEESWDDLIKALENENQEKETNVISEQQVDWTAVIKAAEVANQNEKKLQEMAANERISNYKQRTQTRADKAIERAFRPKTRRRTP
jgi:hypothetical protein